MQKRRAVPKPAMKPSGGYDEPEYGTHPEYRMKMDIQENYVDESGNPVSPPPKPEPIKPPHRKLPFNERPLRDNDDAKLA